MSKTFDNAKKKVKLLLIKNPNVMRKMQFAYNILLKRERLMKRCSFGDKNPDKTIFVIRPNSEDGIQGLMSLFIQTMRWFEYADSNGYKTYVDFLNYKTQYYDGKNNAWDYYFKQDLSNEEVYSSKNVILSGNRWSKTVSPQLFRENIFKSSNVDCCHQIIKNHVVLSEEVEELLATEAERLNISECLGLYVRGTDYIQLKPTGEFVQPDIQDVIKKVWEFLRNHNNPPIFLVTEDGAYYRKLKSEFGEKIVLVSYDSFIENYDGKDYLSRSNVLKEDKKQRGMEYLVKILLISKCRYLVSSITTGSLAAYSFNGGNYEDEYIFDLGLYK